MNQCEIVLKSELSNSFGLINTPLFSIMAYFNPEIGVILQELSQNLRLSQPTDEIFLFGDFHCRIDKPDDKTNALMQYLHLQNLNFINKKEEKKFVNSQRSSTIDLCFTNASHRVSDRKTTTSLLSNHRLLTLSITCDYKTKDETGETIFDINVKP